MEQIKQTAFSQNKSQNGKKVHLSNFPHTVICIASSSAKFDICTVVGLNGRLVEAKIRTFKCPKLILASTFKLTRVVQMPNFALIETKQITVQQIIPTF
jgi:hypothetical protein